MKCFKINGFNTIFFTIFCFKRRQKTVYVSSYFVPWTKKLLQKGLLLKVRIGSWRSKFLSLKVDPHREATGPRVPVVSAEWFYWFSAINIHVGQLCHIWDPGASAESKTEWKWQDLQCIMHPRDADGRANSLVWVCTFFSGLYFPIFWVFIVIAISGYGIPYLR